MQHSTVSVIIPCYRDAATLVRALDSIAAQTKPVEEIIVVNDCSPESELIEKVLLAYPHVIYLKNPINIGLAATRNIGIRHASGKFVAFLDADDEMHPQKNELQLIAHRPGTAVTCQVEVVFPNHISSRRYFDETGPIEEYKDVCRQLYRNTLNGAGLFIERDLLVSIGAYDESLRSCEDFDLWFRLISAGIVVRRLALPLYLYHHNPFGLSKNFRNISNWEIVVLGKYFSSPNAIGNERRNQIFAFWFLKHLMRYELTRDQALLVMTQKNIQETIDCGLTRQALTLISRLHLLRPIAWLRLAAKAVL